MDLAYLGETWEAEDAAFDHLYESLQRALGEGNFDLVPLRRASLHLWFQIATKGRLLLSRDPVAVQDFEARSIVRFLDFKPYRERYFSGTA